MGGAGGGPALHCQHHGRGAILRGDPTCAIKKREVSNKGKEEEKEKQDVVEILIMMTFIFWRTFIFI